MSPDVESHPFGRPTLPVGAKDEGPPSIHQAVVAAVSDQADNLYRGGLRAPKSKDLSDRIVIIEIHARKGFVNHCDLGRPGSVTGVELAAGEQRSSDD